MKRKPYPTDLSDEQWKLLETMLPPPEQFGRKRSVNLREIFNALLYLLRSGCAWRMLPYEFPNWTTVYYYFQKRRDAEWFAALNDRLRRLLRKQQARDENASAAIIDSQSVKTTEEGSRERGFDAGKKINGRKRHILVDTLGLLLAVKVHAADVQDRDGAKLLLTLCRERLPRLFLIWADGGYRGKLIKWVALNCLWLLEIVKRSDDVAGFQVLPRRWVVERTFAWLNKQRRLSKDYERECQTSEAWIYLKPVHKSE
ncbi:MAG: IS5 family transposase [Acidobacteriota bacterium]|nr:IS5 family transposase [Acidobacteriota bacterium]